MDGQLRLDDSATVVQERGPRRPKLLPAGGPVADAAQHASRQGCVSESILVCPPLTRARRGPGKTRQEVPAKVCGDVQGALGCRAQPGEEAERQGALSWSAFRAAELKIGVVGPREVYGRGHGRDPAVDLPANRYRGLEEAQPSPQESVLHPPRNWFVSLHVSGMEKLTPAALYQVASVFRSSHPASRRSTPTRSRPSARS